VREQLAEGGVGFAAPDQGQQGQQGRRPHVGDDRGGQAVGGGGGHGLGEDGHAEAARRQVGDGGGRTGLEGDVRAQAGRRAGLVDGAGARAQVVRRQADGSWLRLLDQPEFVSPAD